VTANAHWDRLVDQGLAHPGDNTPPAGALLFYDTGESAGHVALYLGDDMVASNDVLSAGSIGIVHRKDIAHGTWRLRYRGWAEPAFPGAGGTSI
jgi:cell wall-associated NlpC family hydrolase